MKVTIKCDQCGKEFLRDDYLLKKKKHNFCCHKCSTDFNIGKTTITKEGREKLRLSKLGENNPFFNKHYKEHPSHKGGANTRGYIKVKVFNHPYSNKDNYILEHRLVMEKAIGRYLKPNEIVHHINQIKTDNRIENLMLFSNKEEHIKFHSKEKVCLLQ